MRDRVLIVHPSGVSGIWHYANSLSRALSSIGFDVALVAQSPYEDLGDFAGGPVFTIGHRMSTCQSVIAQVTHRAMNHGEKIARFGALVARLRPSIVHLHAPLGGLDWAYFRVIRSLGAKVIYTAHDASPLIGEATWPDWARYRAADHVFVHSRSCANSLTANGITPKKISVVPHGSYLHLCLDAELPKAVARRRLGLAEDALVLLFFGALSPYKGLETLVSALQIVLLQNSSIKLVIAGHPRMDVLPILKRIESLGLRDHVLLDLRYIPFEEFAPYFRSAEAVILPYSRISQSGVLQLAYGFARPVVVTDVGGLGEAVRDDGTGAIACVEDADSLANAIASILTAPSRAEEMGRRARQLSETKYSWRAIGEITARVYREVQRD